MRLEHDGGSAHSLETTLSDSTKTKNREGAREITAACQPDALDHLLERDGLPAGVNWSGVDVIPIAVRGNG
ncbi:MAG: hypothetical protein ACRDJ9_02230 [Dehalococcoidia bacterium]